MAQQSILGRITQLARANINALIDSAEDPEKMLDQMIRDYTGSISEAEDAVAQSIGNLRMMEGDKKEADEAAVEWGGKAAAAAAKATRASPHRYGRRRQVREPGAGRPQAPDRLRGPVQVVWENRSRSSRAWSTSSRPASPR